MQSKEQIIVIDIEANGPIPGDYSMTSLGAVILDDKLDKTFSVNIKPISENFFEDRLRFVDSENAVDAQTAMKQFSKWIGENIQGEVVVYSDNNGFDWMFVCWYFWHFLEENPLGYNSQNMTSLLKGLKHNLDVNVSSLRTAQLTHKAEQDAIDNARVLKKILEEN